MMRMLKSTQGGLPGVADAVASTVADAVASTVLQVCVERDVFSSFKEHMFNSTVVNNHVFNLIKGCARCYVTIRMHHLCKQKNANMHGRLVRKGYSKLILFKGQ